MLPALLGNPYTISFDFNKQILHFRIDPFVHTTFFFRDGGSICPVEAGKKGELCVSGACLASCYIYDEEKTDVKFVDNPAYTDGDPY